MHGVESDKRDVPQTENIILVGTRKELEQEMVQVVRIVTFMFLSKALFVVALDTNIVLQLVILNRFEQVYPSKDACGVIGVYEQKLIRIVVASIWSLNYLNTNLSQK